MTFEYGQIILAPFDDGHGNTKIRPTLIISPNDQILPGGPLRVVCISTQIEDPCPSYHVKLPWQNPRHPRTGLNKPNVAKCDWREQIGPAAVIRVLGFAPAAHLARIEEELGKLAGTRAGEVDGNEEGVGA